MLYLKAEPNRISELIALKNSVKQRVADSGLKIWQHGYPYDEMIEEDVKNGYARIVVVDGSAVAYAALYPCLCDYPPKTFKSDNMLSFGRLMVKTEYLNRHIASFLVQKMIQEAKLRQYDGVGILVDDFNLAAVNLYKKYGFEREGAAQFEFAYLDIYGLYF